MKSNLHRKMQGRRTGYMANNPNLLPSWKDRYKATSNRNMRRVLDQELQALVITDHASFNTANIPDHIRMAHGDFNFDPTLDDLLAQWREDEEIAYQQWCDEQCSGDYVDSYYDHHDPQAEGYWDFENVALVMGDYELKSYCADSYHAYRGYDCIGSILLDRDSMRWEVAYMPMHGPQVAYTFDYLESSPEHALQLLAMLHRMGASHEGFEDVPY